MTALPFPPAAQTAGRRLPARLSDLARVAGLAAAAFTVSLAHLPVGYGLDLVFGSVFAMLAIHWLGTGAGVLVAAIGGAYTIILWHHPYAWLILIAEALCVGVLHRYLRPRGEVLPLAAADGIYWLILGMPLVALSYGGPLAMTGTEVALVAFKQAINGVLNAALAGAIILGIQLLRRRADTVPIGEILFTSMVLAVLVPALSVSIFQIRRLTDAMEADASDTLTLASRLAAARFNRPEPPPNLTAARAELPELLAQIHWLLPQAGGITMTLLPAPDHPQPAAPDGMTARQSTTEPNLQPATGPRLSRMTRFRKGRFQQRADLTLAGAPVQLVSDLTATRAVEALQRVQLSVFRHLSIILVLALIGAFVFSRRIGRPIAALAAIASRLPAQLDRPEHEVAPRPSRLREIAEFSAAFTRMEAALRADIKARQESERELRHSERRLARAQRAGRVGVWELDIATRTVWFSDESLRLFELPPDQALVDYAVGAAVVHPEDLPSMEAAIAQALAERRPYHLVLRLRFAANRVKHTSVDGEPVDDAGIIRIIGTIRDITAETLAEQVLAQSEARFRAVFEQAPIGMAIVGPDRRPQFTNPALERILGRDAATIQTLRFDDFTHPEDLDTDLCLFQELLAGRRASYRMTKRYLRPDGTLVWGDLSVALLPARDGEAPLPLGLVQDITEQRFAEQGRAAAEQALQRYSAKLEAFSELTTRYQPPAQHLPALLNYGCQSLGVGLAALAEVRDQHYRLLVAVGDTAADSNGAAGPVLVNDAAADPSPMPRHPVFGADLAFLTRMELTWSDAEGVVHHGLLDLADRTAAPHLGQPEQQILTLMAQRISANLREQAVLDGLLQARQREVIGHLAAGVAHDFNNVLGVIGSNLHHLGHLLSAAADAGEARDVLAETKAAIAQAKVVTSGLLSLGRGEEVSVGPCPLGELVQDFAPVIQRLLPPRIALTLDLTPGISVLSNPALLQAALLNLALNARDAMGAAGQLTIRVTALPTAGIAATGSSVDDLAGYGELCVMDTGVGMTPAVRARLFEPLFSTKARGRGTGLGLFMVQEFARRSHGVVQITSAPGAGTCVRLRLPLSPRSMTVTHGADQGLVRSSAARAPDPSAGPPAILLVDDEPLICKALRRPLEQAGYRVRVAVDGADALDRLADGPTINLVLSDIAMPRLDGLALHRTLGLNRPELPVILMSGDPSATADARARNPTLRILSKPVDIQALLAVLRGILQSPA